MSYTFKTGPELAWFLLSTIVPAVAAAIVAQGPNPPADWTVWGAALLASVVTAVVRPILGGIIALKDGSSPS